jgi:hypothetical protein
VKVPAYLEIEGNPSHLALLCVVDVMAINVQVDVPAQP